MQIESRIFCLGHISVDIIVHRSALGNLRIGGCIDTQDLGIYAGGDSANVAFWLGTLGMPTTMVGIIGDDPTGFFLRKNLENANVECKLKISTKHPSSSILIIVESDGERSHIINGKSQDDLNWGDLPLEEIEACRLFYTSAYTIENKPIKSTIEKLLKEIKSSGLTTPDIMFNLAAFTTIERHYDDIKKKIIPNTDILVGNTDEFRSITRELSVSGDDDFLRLGKKMQQEYPNLKIIIITNGSKGCYYFTKSHQKRIYTKSVSVVDTTGAGDAFCAGFVAKYVFEDDIIQALKFGSKLGGYVCQGYGARFGSPEIKPLL